MRIKKLLAAVLAAALLYTGIPVLAQGGAVLKLPAAIQIISEEAFLDSAVFERVEVPNGAREIHARAFAGSSLREIRLPASVKFIADDAFEGCKNLLIEAVTDSYALKWAEERGYTVMEMENSDPSQGENELPWVPASE